MAYARWDVFEIKGVAASLPEFKAQLTRLHDEKVAIEAKLVTIVPLGNEYAMAAMLRFGDVQAGYALKIGNLRLPRFLVTTAGANTPLATFPNVLALFQEAKRNWVQVFESAKRAGIWNKWSRLAYENLSREFPSEYPPFHQEIIEGTDKP